MGFLKSIGRALKAALRPLVPGLRAAGGGRPRPVLRWIFRILIVSAVLVGLWLLNRYLELDRYVRRRCRPCASSGSRSCSCSSTP